MPSVHEYFLLSSVILGNSGGQERGCHPNTISGQRAEGRRRRKNQRDLRRRLSVSGRVQWVWSGYHDDPNPSPCSWNDVNQHWTSLCKLLLETLIRLEATYAELQHILMIRYCIYSNETCINLISVSCKNRSDEFDWLGHSEREAAEQRCCHGDVGRVEEEIVRHQVKETTGSCDMFMTSLLHHLATVVRGRRSQ